MNTWTKFGSFLGTLSFAVLAAVGIHQYTEVKYVNAHQPPTLTQLQSQVVTLETGESICSGWISAKTGKIVTAAHCFAFDNTQPHDAIIHFQDGHTELWVTDYVSGDEQDSKSDHATLVNKDKSDLTKHPGLRVCNFKPYYGEFTVIMGAPLGVDKSMNFGYVQNPAAGDFIAIDVKTLPGNSGGPVIDIEEGCVIGSAEAVYSAGVMPKYVGVNYAISVAEF